MRSIAASPVTAADAPLLFAVDDVVVAVLHSRGAQRRHVTAGVGLGDAEADDFAALRSAALATSAPAARDRRRGSRTCRHSGATRAFSAALPKCSTGGKPICARRRVLRQRSCPGMSAARRASRGARRGAEAPRCPAGAARAQVARHAAAAACAVPRACSPSTSPHTTPPEPQRQISSIKISSWKASNPCAAPMRRRGALARRASQRPNRLGRFMYCPAPRTHLGRRPGVRRRPGRPHHARQQARGVGFGE